MTLSGTKVENFTAFDKNLDKIVVGQIESVEKHPDADKLVICQVNVGSETDSDCNRRTEYSGGFIRTESTGCIRWRTVWQVVMTAVALPEDGIKIKKGKLRGVESFGMMCAIEELGSSREFYPDAPENGIYILGDDAQVGEDAVHYLGLDDTVFEYEITNNRVDCYSIIGIAREAAATFRKPFTPPVVTETGNAEDINDYVKVDVEDHRPLQPLHRKTCKEYQTCSVTEVDAATDWQSAGIRPINNIVDITNYVMEEYGQPMHAYDYDTLAGR